MVVRVRQIITMVRVLLMMGIVRNLEQFANWFAGSCRSLSGRAIKTSVASTHEIRVEKLKASGQRAANHSCQPRITKPDKALAMREIRDVDSASPLAITRSPAACPSHWAHRLLHTNHENGLAVVSDSHPMRTNEKPSTLACLACAKRNRSTTQSGFARRNRKFRVTA